MNIFVFGSNLAGRHGKGAALHARQQHGAIYGQAEGIQGASYGIPTKTASLVPLLLPSIEMRVKRFLEFAREHPEMTFNVTPIGCGLAGYKPEQIAPFFQDAPTNVILPDEFKIVIEIIQLDKMSDNQIDYSDIPKIGDAPERVEGGQVGKFHRPK